MATILFRTLLGGNGNFSFSLDCVASFTKFCKNKFKLEIFEDGSLSASQIIQLEKLGDVKVISRELRDPILNQKLINYPNCYRFRQNHVFSYKILDTMLYDDHDFYYFDTDILFLKNFTFEIKYPNHPVFMKDKESSYAFSCSKYLQSSWKVFPKLNAGFMFFPKKLFKITELENIIIDKFNEEELKNCWAEQTMWAFIASNRTFYFNPNQIVMADAFTRVKNKTVAIHLTTPFRYKTEKLKLRNSLSNAVIPLKKFEIKSFLNPYNYLIIKNLYKIKRKILRSLSIMPNRF